jgi:hypothetical protein
MVDGEEVELGTLLWHGEGDPYALGAPFEFGGRDVQVVKIDRTEDGGTLHFGARSRRPS